MRQKTPLLVIGLLAFLWIPVNRGAAHLSQTTQRQARQLDRMQWQAQEIQSLRQKGVGLGPTAENPLTTIEELAEKKGIKIFIRSMKQEGDTGFLIHLESVPFNELMAWLDELGKSGGLRVEKATVEAEPAIGLVQASLILR